MANRRTAFRRPSEARRAYQTAWTLWKVSWRSSLEYRGNLGLAFVGGAIFQGAQLLFVGTLVLRFGSIAGWGPREIALLFGVRLAAHAFYSVPCGNLYQIDRLVQEGGIDRMLLRPANVWIQVLTDRFPLMSIGDAVLGMGALVVAAAGAPVDWTMGRLMFLAVAVVSGGMAEAGIQTFLAGLTFRHGATKSIRGLADDVLTRVGPYPLTAFGTPGLVGLSTAFPIAFIAYVPTAMLLGRLDEGPVPGWVGYVGPAINVLIFVAGLTAFERQTRHYVSPGG